MITDCPACERQFRLHAWQLSAAGGLVQCGFCGQQFNALERLYDHPDEVPVPSRDDGHEEYADEPQFIIPDKSAFESVEDPDDNAIDEGSDGSKDEDLRTYDEDELSEELIASGDTRGVSWGRLAWGVGVLLLLIVAALQIAWFNRDWILLNYPEYRPLAERICGYFSCEIVRDRQLDDIVLVNRDVRDHPRFAGTLLVNATIENRSDVIQPYPRIRLTLYDTEGRITGYRVFGPGDYLDESIDADAGMPIGIPVHVVLEVTGSTETAVSFEFHFM